MDIKQQTFDQLIDRDLGMLRAAALRILGNPFDADEAIQQSLLTAWKKFESFKNHARLSSWLYRITMNSSYDMLRKKQRENRKLDYYAQHADPGPERPDTRLDELELAIASLPELYREAIAIGFLSGFDGEKAAEILECSVNTLHQRVHKAKQLLKQKLESI